MIHKLSREHLKSYADGSAPGAKGMRMFPICDVELVFCPHDLLVFGCQSCINRAHYVEMKKAYESPGFVIPNCSECGYPMALSDYDLPAKFMTFECTNHTNEYEYCGHEERVKL